MNAAVMGIVAALGWGVADFGARFSGRAVGPLNALLGMLFTGAFLLTIWVWADDSPVVWQWSDLWLLVLSGVTAMLGTLCVYRAVTIGPVTVAAPLIASYPALVVLAAIFAGNFPSPLQWLAIFGVMSGVMLVAGSGETVKTGLQGSSVKPRLFDRTVPMALLASLGLACSIIAGQSVASSAGHLQTTWMIRVISLVSLLFLFLLLPRKKISIPLKWWPLVAAQGILDTVAFIATFAGGMTYNPEITAVVGSCFGGVTVLLGWFFLGEVLKLKQWVGVVLIIVSVATLVF